MNFITALKAKKLLEEIDLNSADMEIFRNAINNGIEGVQLNIVSKNGAYNSTIYKKDRIGLLLKVLYEENTKLMTELREL